MRPTTRAHSPHALRATVFLAALLGAPACVSSMPAARTVDGPRAVSGEVAAREGELCVGALGRQCYATAGAAPTLPRSAEDESALAATAILACRAGEARACNDAGVAYAVGLGAAVEPKLATKSFVQACAGGSASGCKNAGTQYRFGKDVDPNDPRAAARFYAMACDKGAESGCYELAELLRLGTLVPVDAVRALSLYEQACAGGYGQACARLGYVYGTGAGRVRKDEALAYAKNQRGCELGSKNGCAGVGFQMLKGLGATKDEAGAARLLERTCQQGGAAACVTLGRLYVTPERRNLQHAARLFQGACDLMDMDGEGSGGCYFYGLMVRDGTGVPKNVPWGTALLHRACDVGGQAIACTALGLMYHAGALVPVDVVKAAHLFDLACKYGDAEGCTDLGAAYLTGQGLAANREKALELFTYGCERNVEKACSDLKVFGAANAPAPLAQDVRL